MKLNFGECTLDMAERRLLCRGQDVHLAPKAFDLLGALVEHRPRAMSKAELIERVWPDVFVADDSLAKVVSQIRKALGDQDSSPIIRTVHGYGYAFAATVDGADQARLDEQRRAAVCWLICGTREFPLTDGEHIVGRERDAGICLESPLVSRRHARLVVNGIKATIEDLGSKNGLLVRGVRISGPTRLESGDEADIGPFKLLFRVAGDSGSTLTGRR